MKADFQIRILGKSSAIPTKDSFPSSQVVLYQSSAYLVDCGEACQMQIRRNHISMKNIRHIFISHLHGDHYFGLFGFISTMNLLGRKHPLHIYSHQKLQHILKYVFYQGGEGPAFPIIFHDLSYDKKEMILETKYLKVYSFPLCHRIPTCGFSFEEKTVEQNIRPEMIAKYELDYLEIRRIKQGSDLIRNGENILQNSELCFPVDKPRKYAYCSDTTYASRIADYVKSVDLLYHEATFAEDMADKIETKFHSTAKQAALTAKNAEVGQLLIGHFSTRYKDVSQLEIEAKEIFSNTIAVNENDLFIIK
jgi:ribonuclease Z